MATIKWNKITWYSKLLAVILFVLTFYIGFNLGKEKTKINTIGTNNEIPAKTPPKQTVVDTTPASISNKNIKEENFSGTMPIISGSGEVELRAREYVEVKVAEFRKQANTDVPDMREKFGADNPTAQYTIDISAKHVQGEKTRSIVMSIYAYTGGANGNSSYKVITASRANGKILSLSDVIKQEEKGAFTEFVKKELNAWRPGESEGPVVFVDEVKNLKFDSFSNWSIDDNNLIIYFDKYEVGPGALGAVAFPLKIEEIKNFLNSTFL